VGCVPAARAGVLLAYGCGRRGRSDRGRGGRRRPRRPRRAVDDGGRSRCPKKRAL